AEQQASSSSETSPSETSERPPASTGQAEQTGEAGAAKSTGGGDGFSWPRFWQQFASGIRMGLMLALGAVGLSMVFGTTGLSNFAHAEMLSMGGILAFLFMQLTGNIWIAGTIAVAIMAF